MPSLHWLPRITWNPDACRETTAACAGNDLKEMTMSTFNSRISVATATLATIALVVLLSVGVSASIAPLIV